MKEAHLPTLLSHHPQYTNHSLDGGLGIGKEISSYYWNGMEYETLYFLQNSSEGRDGCPATNGNIKPPQWLCYVSTHPTRNYVQPFLFIPLFYLFTTNLFPEVALRSVAPAFHTLLEYFRTQIRSLISANNAIASVKAKPKQIKRKEK